MQRYSLAGAASNKARFSDTSHELCHSMPEKPVPRVPIPRCVLQLVEVGSSAPCTTDDWRLCSPKLSRTRSSVWTHVRGAYVATSAACTSQNGSRQSAIAPVTVYRLPSATRAKTANARWRGKHSKGVMTHDCAGKGVKQVSATVLVRRSQRQGLQGKKVRPLQLASFRSTCGFPPPRQVRASLRR